MYPPHHHLLHHHPSASLHHHHTAAKDNLAATPAVHIQQSESMTKIAFPTPGSSSATELFQAQRQPENALAPLNHLFATLCVDLCRTMACHLRVPGTTLFRASALIHRYIASQETEHQGKSQEEEKDQNIKNGGGKMPQLSVLNSDRLFDDALYIAAAAVWCLTKVECTNTRTRSVAAIVDTMKQRFFRKEAGPHLTFPERDYNADLSVIFKNLEFWEWKLLESDKIAFQTACALPHTYCLLFFRLLTTSNSINNEAPDSNCRDTEISSDAQHVLNVALEHCNDAARSRQLCINTDAKVVACVALNLASNGYLQQSEPEWYRALGIVSAELVAQATAAFCAIREMTSHNAVDAFKLAYNNMHWICEAAANELSPFPTLEASILTHDENKKEVADTEKPSSKSRVEENDNINKATKKDKETLHKRGREHSNKNDRSKSPGTKRDNEHSESPKRRERYRSHTPPCVRSYDGKRGRSWSPYNDRDRRSRSPREGRDRLIPRDPPHKNRERQRDPPRERYHPSRCEERYHERVRPKISDRSPHSDNRGARGRGNRDREQYGRDRRGGGNRNQRYR